MAQEPKEEIRVVQHRHLTSEPELWDVKLRDGRAIQVMAHAWTIEGDECVFSVLFEGRPNVDVPVLRIPKDLLADMD